MMTLPESPERAAANAASCSRNPKRWVIAGRDVEPRLEHDRHLVPGLVHLAAVDAPEGQHLEHDRVDVERDLLGRDAEDGDPAAVGHRCRCAARSAAGLPDISIATSKPSTMSSSARTSAEVALARVDGERRAHPRRRARGGTAFGSLTTTWRAPAWRATAVAISPIGPAPLTSTSSPRTGKASAVWTALPNGSKIAATSSSTPGQWCQTLVIGSATYSAKAPSRPTPRPIVLAHRWRRPARQWRHSPQTTWPSPRDEVARREVVRRSRPTSTISPTNSWPTTSGGWIVFAAHGSHDSMWRSVPQIPVLWTRIRTSLMPIVGIGTSRRLEARARRRS